MTTWIGAKAIVTQRVGWLLSVVLLAWLGWEVARRYADPSKVGLGVAALAWSVMAVFALTAIWCVGEALADALR